LRKLRAGPARSLSPTLYRQPDGLGFLNATTPRTISRRGGFVRVPALIAVIPASQSVVSIQGLRWSAVARMPVVNLSRIAAGQAISGVPTRGCRLIASSVLRRAVFRSAVPSQRRRTRSAGCHEMVVHFPKASNVARSPVVVVAAEVVEPEAQLYNKPINPTPFAASRRLLAQASRRGSCAGYRHRYAH
jgi:hypothetical protein